MNPKLIVRLRYHKALYEQAAKMHMGNILEKAKDGTDSRQRKWREHSN